MGGEIQAKRTTGTKTWEAGTASMQREAQQNGEGCVHLQIKESSKNNSLNKQALVSWSPKHKT